MAKNKTAPSAALPGTVRPAWEYRRSHATDGQLCDALAEAGADGWELISRVLRASEPNQPASWDLLFKRPA